MLTDPALCAAYESDFTGRYTARARLVVRPAGTARVVPLCREAGAPLLPQGGNTGLVGASAPGGAGEVVLSLRRLTGIGPVDAATRRVTVGAGLPLAGLQRQKPCLIRA
ncbi:FAD-binding oxidoreductase [Streptomyces sp. bgisy082]|uniref:FAD-binding oxidoreductase n=1 Tax=Streptomyces sp. bgisy082 TaxID=3413776 RepID=UPI003D75AA39